MSDFLPIDLFRDYYFRPVRTGLSRDETSQRQGLIQVNYDERTGRYIDNLGNTVRHRLIGVAQNIVPETSSLDQLAAEHKPPEANAFFPRIGKSSVVIQYLSIE